MKTTKRFNPWPLSIAGLGLFFLALTAWSIIQARSGVSTVTDPDYYSHGLKFQQTSVERRAAAASNWHLQTSLDGRIVEASLTDGDGPVSGATGELRLFAVASAAPTTAFEEISPGRYRARLSDGLAGAIPAALTLRRDGSLLEKRLQLNVRAAD